MEIDPKAKRRAIVSLVVAGAILWFPVARLLLGHPPGFLRDLGFFSGPSGTPIAWGLALVVAFLYAGFTVRNNPLVREHWRALSLAKALGVTVAVAAAIVEEAFFRRLLMDGLLAAEISSIGQILLSGVVFGLAHGIWGIVTGRLMLGLRVMVATGTVGIALAVVYLVGDRSLAPPIVSHFMITATIQPGIMFAAFSGQMPRPEPGWWRLTSR
jgi:hypothetical protein